MLDSLYDPLEFDFLGQIYIEEAHCKEGLEFSLAPNNGITLGLHGKTSLKALEIQKSENPH